MANGGETIKPGLRIILFPVANVAMESSVQRNTRVLLIFVFLGFFVIRVNGDFDYVGFERKLVALYKVVRYIRDRPWQMTIDTIYGITLTEASLVKTLLHPNSYFIEKIHIHDLRKLLEFCYSTRQILTNVIIPINEDMKVLKKVLNNPKFWIREIYWVNNTLTVLPLSFFSLFYETGENLTMKGRPNEFESNYCLIKIAREQFFNKCSIPHKCVQMIRNNDNVRGYPLTHRLLIIQMSRAMGCKESRALPYSKLLPFYCSRILGDMIGIELMGFPYNARDLLMEEVILCGLEGYLEFMNKHYEDLILSWSHPSGCYSAFGDFQSKNNMNTDFGCDSHATGLGAASLALFIRKDIENTFD